MRASLFYLMLIFLWPVSFTAQKTDDSLKKRAYSVTYEQPDEAISIALKLLKKEKKVDEVAHLNILISTAYLAKKNNDSSLYYILKAANLINTDASPKTKIKILFAVAIQYQQMELYDKALESLEQAQKMIDRFPGTPQDELYNSAFMNSTRGIIYLNQSNPDLALEKFRIAEQNFRKLPLEKKSAANLSINNYNMGNCFLDLAQVQQALSYFTQSEKYAKIYQENILQSYALKGQGESFFLLHDYEKSLAALYEAEKIAEPIDDLVLKEEIFTFLADNNLAIGNIEEFQFYNNKSLAIQKTLEQDELKSLNRYLNSQEEEQKKNTASISNRFLLFDWLTALITFGLLVFILKKIYRIHHVNDRQRKIIETLTKAKKVI